MKSEPIITRLSIVAVVAAFCISGTSAIAETKKAPAKEAAPAAPAATTNAIYPPSISSKYSKETPGKARMHTCLDQYNANKANNANGGLNWIQKGGGYYSECNKRLKG